jgi:hypothetical protein
MVSSFIRRLGKRGNSGYVNIPKKFNKFFIGVDYVKLTYDRNRNTLVVTPASDTEFASGVNEWIRVVSRGNNGGYTYLFITLPSALVRKWTDVDYVRVTLSDGKLLIRPI